MSPADEIELLRRRLAAAQTEELAPVERAAMFLTLASDFSEATVAWACRLVEEEYLSRQ